MAIDIEQHPRDWKRRISSVELCLSTGSPAVKKLQKSYKDWNRLGPEVTEEYNKAVDALFESWHEATREIEQNNAGLKEHKKWWFSVRLSIAAIVLSTLSIVVSTFFQYENLKISKKRLDLQVNSTSKVSKTSVAAISTNNKITTPIATHNKSMQPTANAAAD